MRHDPRAIQNGLMEMIRRTFSKEMATIKQELLDMKTAQQKPAIFRLYTYALTPSTVQQSTGPRTYRIHYEQAETTPLLWLSRFTQASIYARPYNTATCTQDVRVDIWSAGTVTFVSTHKIESVSYEGQLPDPVFPSGWIQVLSFDPNRMGKTAGWCLQNTRLGFGIPYGTFQSAIADMQSQRANGTLHPINGRTEMPPYNIACPVYIDTGVVDGHVCAWDHGVIWNDGYRWNGDFADMGTVWGWGEYCDGQRVVRWG